MSSLSVHNLRPYKSAGDKGRVRHEDNGLLSRRTSKVYCCFPPSACDEPRTVLDELTDEDDGTGGWSDAKERCLTRHLQLSATYAITYAPPPESTVTTTVTME
jgi:hypothetical protein